MATAHSRIVEENTRRMMESIGALQKQWFMMKNYFRELFRTFSPRKK